MVKKQEKSTHRGRQPDGKPNLIDVHVGNRIRQRRNLMGMSQEAMAARLGLTFQQLQKYERGINRVSGSRLYDISQILKVPVDYFFEEMDADLASQTPSNKTDEEIPSDFVDPLRREEVISLIKAYNNIQDQDISQSIYKLMIQMAYPNKEDL